MALWITHPDDAGTRRQLHDVLAGWDEARIAAGLRDETLIWVVERDLIGRLVYLLMTTTPDTRRVIATSYFPCPTDERYASGTTTESLIRVINGKAESRLLEAQE